MKKFLGLLVMSGAVLSALFLLTHVTAPSASQTAPAFTLKPATEIHDGAIVTIEYTLKDEAGGVIESTSGKEPLTYVQGAGQIVPGLEKALDGLQVGDEKQVRVSPDEGYGTPDEKAFQELPKDRLPADAQKVGTMLMTKGPDGRMIPMRVHKVENDKIIVDLNHPLAGKTLNFDVKVKDIKSAEPK